MLTQIIDIISKDRDKRKLIIVFCLKIFLTALLSIDLFKVIYGDFHIISIFDYNELISFILNGMALKSLAVFAIVWIISYFIIYILINWISIKLTLPIYEGLAFIVKNPEKIEKEIKNSERLQRFLLKQFKRLNKFDVIEIEGKKVSPGSSFYKFYDYLKKIDSGADTVKKGEFSDYISIIIQFIILNFTFNLYLIDFNWLTWLISVCIFISLIFFFFVIIVFLNVVDLRYRRLIRVMKKLDPSINNMESIEESSLQSTSEKESPRNSQEHQQPPKQ